MRTKYRQKTHRSDQNKWFHCIRCNRPIVPQAVGTDHRNHCNWCLWSKHLDDIPGDRDADCGGAMEPIAVWVRRGSDWAIIHQCRKCGELHSNRIAGDDNEIALVSLAVRAISQPPFPLEHLQLTGEPTDLSWSDPLAGNAPNP